MGGLHILGHDPASWATAISLRLADANKLRAKFNENLLPDLTVISDDTLRNFTDGFYLLELKRSLLSQDSPPPPAPPPPAPAPSASAHVDDERPSPIGAANSQPHRPRSQPAPGEQEAPSVLVDPSVDPSHDDCALCHEAVDPQATGNLARLTLQCQHSFHGECILQWCASDQRNHGRCPLCRAHTSGSGSDAADAPAPRSPTVLDYVNGLSESYPFTLHVRCPFQWSGSRDMRVNSQNTISWLQQRCSMTWMNGNPCHLIRAGVQLDTRFPPGTSLTEAGLSNFNTVHAIPPPCLLYTSPSPRD